jgi:transposase-like protein
MFKGRHFDRSVILLCVRWYLAYGLSLRDLEDMMEERNIQVDHSTVHRWVLRFSRLWCIDRCSRSVLQMSHNGSSGTAGAGCAF